MTNRDATFTAGPAISNTRAVPGDRPFSIRVMAMGIEPVAQRYIGMAHTNTNNMLSRGVSAKSAKNEFGTKTVMSPAMINPMTNHLPMSCIISTKA